MAGSLRRHEEAAARHDRAAATHERSAAFWNEHGNRARADLHHDAAAHERAGAALERRWADVISSERAGAETDDRAREDPAADVEAQSIERDRIAEGRDREADAREEAASERDPLHRGIRAKRDD